MERKEPTLSGTIKPEKDEVAARQPRSSAPGPKGPRRAEEPPTTPPSGRPPGDSGGSGGQGLAVAALILALIGLGGSGFLAWKWIGAEENLAQANNRIEGLEQRLDITSDQSSEYVDEIQDKLDWADSEIRKLWGVSNDTNRKNIAQNKERVESLQQSVSQIKQTAESASNGVDNLRSSLSDIDSRVGELNSSLEEVQEQTGSLAEHQQRLQNLVEDVDDLERQVSELDGLASRVGTNEEAIEAIDSYRRSINRELLEIKDRLSSSP